MSQPPNTIVDPNTADDSDTPWWRLVDPGPARQERGPDEPVVAEEAPQELLDFWAAEEARLAARFDTADWFSSTGGKSLAGDDKSGVAKKVRTSSDGANKVSESAASKVTESAASTATESAASTVTEDTASTKKQRV